MRSCATRVAHLVADRSSLQHDVPIDPEDRGADGARQLLRRLSRRTDAEIEVGRENRIRCPGRAADRRSARPASGLSGTPSRAPRRRRSTCPANSRPAREMSASAVVRSATRLARTVGRTLRSRSSTFGVAGVSRASKSRPASTAMPKAANMPGVIQSDCLMRSAPGGGDVPGGDTTKSPLRCASERRVHRSARKFDAGHGGHRLDQTVIQRVALDPGTVGALIVTSRVSLRSKPSGTRVRWLNVLTNSPAATTSASDTATCATTTRLETPARPACAFWPRSFSASIGATRDAWIAERDAEQDRRHDHDSRRRTPARASRSARRS